MNDISKKLTFIYARYLLIAIGSIIIYTFFRWLLDIKLNILYLKEDILDFWLPFTLPLIPVVIWLRPGIRFLNIRGKRDNGHFIYLLIATFSISIPNIITQEYCKALSSKLIIVKSVSEIKSVTKTDCYKIADFNVDKDFVTYYGTSRCSGRNNERLTYYRYFAVPVVDHNYATDILHQKYWFGIKFSKEISNYDNQSNKQAEWKIFWEDCQRKFKRYDYTSFQYLKVLGYSDDKDGYIEAIKKSDKSIPRKDVVLLEPVNDPYDQILGNKFGWILGSFGIGSLVFLLMVIIPSIDKKEYKRFIAKKPVNDDGLKEVIRFLIPGKRHIITTILIDINILIFIGMVLAGLNLISPTAKELFDLGGNRREEVLQGEYWRLLTSMFLHSGLIHILSNVFGIAITCGPLELILGKWKTLLVYLISGIGASLFSIYYHENTVSVGASGAIYGMMGLMGALIITKRATEVSGFFIFIIGIFGVLGLILGLAGGVDNTAHMGGLVTGFMIGLTMVVVGFIPKPKPKKRKSAVAVKNEQ